MTIDSLYVYENLTAAKMHDILQECVKYSKKIINYNSTCKKQFSI